MQRLFKITGNSHKYIRNKSLGYSPDIHRREDIHRRGAYATFCTENSREDRNAKGRVIGGREETPYFI